MTHRRVHLAGIEYGENPRNFVRDEEEPLFREIADLLVERSELIADDPSLTTSTQLIDTATATDELCAAVARCQHVVTARLYGRGPLPDESLLFCYAALLVKLRDLPAKPTSPDSEPIVEPFPSANVWLTFHIAHAGMGNRLSPFNDFDLEILRNQYRNALPEVGVFLDFAHNSKQGRRLVRLWRDWLDGCRCERGERQPDCKVHRVLALWDEFIAYRDYEYAPPQRLIDTW